MKTSEKRKIADRIMLEFKNGHICFMTADSIESTLIQEFINQPTEGILYDLNRDEVTTLTLMPDKRWVNDLAVAFTIRALKAEIEKRMSAEDISTVLIKLEETLQKFKDELNNNYDCGNPCIMEQGKISGAEECVNIVRSCIKGDNK